MQRRIPVLSRRALAVVSLLTLAAAPACKGGGDAADGAAKSDGAAKAGDSEPAVDSAGEVAPAEGGEVAASTAGTPVAPSTGEAPAEAEAGAAAAEAGEVAPADAGEEPPVEDPVPALLEQAKSLDTDDATATKALNDAVAAGAAKLDVAKVANARGEALLTKGESERAEPYFVWARDAHNLYAEPVYNLAKLAAYAGDLDVAKEHLQELQKRGNKKLMKKVGVEPAFAPLHDDPDVRKIYEQ